METNYLSNINFAPSNIWGAEPSFILEEYKNLPFAPFNKLEKLGKFCDISNPGSKLPTSTTTTTVPNLPQNEEDEFTVVESRIGTKKVGPKLRVAPTQNKPKTQPGQYTQSYSKNQIKGRQVYNQRTNFSRTKFKDNAGVQTDWVFITDANKANFEKTPVGGVKVADLAIVGRIPSYDKTWDGKLTTKKTTPFSLPNTLTLSTGPRNDKFLLDLIKQEVDVEDPTFYTTDIILSALLTVKSSMFPWDIVVVKEGNQYFLEPSPQNKVSYIDILTVNENTSGNLPEDEKDMLKICIESTNVNRKFIDITTTGTEVKAFNESNEYFKEAPDSKVYRYRKWTLENKIHIVCRSEIDSYVKEGETEKFTKVAALNEFDSILDWKTNYETNRGALISSEVRNNSSKIARWLCQAQLADCENFKLGFVTKPSSKDTKHQVLTVEPMTTGGLSNMTGYKLKDNWSIIKTIVEILGKQEDGVFSFVKMPYKQSLRIYKVPSKESLEDQ